MFQRNNKMCDISGRFSEILQRKHFTHVFSTFDLVKVYASIEESWQNSVVLRNLFVNASRLTRVLESLAFIWLLADVTNCHPLVNTITVHIS
jgi:hypothetical protein